MLCIKPLVAIFMNILRELYKIQTARSSVIDICNKEELFCYFELSWDEERLISVRHEDNIAWSIRFVTTYKSSLRCVIKPMLSSHAC